MYKRLIFIEPRLFVGVLHRLATDLQSGAASMLTPHDTRKFDSLLIIYKTSIMSY